MKDSSVFIGRKYEWNLLEKEYNKESASLVIVYGRRRVGKTHLLTEFYKNKNLWRFDGVEHLSKSDQIRNILKKLSEIVQDPLYSALPCNDWVSLFKIVDRALSTSPWRHRVSLFFDELPYMANRQSEIVAALKWAWDNLWCHQKHFTLILCGSIASFMVKKVIKSSALYGRISLEIALKPLSLPEVSSFFQHRKSLREICQLYMFCGGIPEYLRQFNVSESVVQNIARLAFCKDGYFVGEFDRLFKDVFLEAKIYQKIIKALSHYRTLKIPELVKLLKISPGGGVVEYLENMELSGFVKSIVPWDKPSESRLKRFTIDDEYLHFYFRFIYPHLKNIRENTKPEKAFSYLNSPSYKSWAGFAFERICLKHVPLILQHLHIDQLVKAYGPYFNRQSHTKEGVQIDLLFARHDPVITICEIKYHSSPIGKWIIPEVEKKVTLLGETRKTVEKVLITSEGATNDLKESQYFSKILTMEELFRESIEQLK